MGISKHCLCESMPTCYYAVMIDGRFYVCDYIGDVGKSRVHNDPKGEIINGKCGYYKDKRDEGTAAGAKARIDRKRKKRHVL